MLNNLKIRVTSEAESKEAQELFFELGYGWYEYGKKASYLQSPFLYAEYGDTLLFGQTLKGFNEDEGKEITLPQLREMVVLKRNDVNDATHECMGDKFLVQENRRYEWTYSGWATSGIAMSKLKPIQEQQVASHNIEQQALQANPKLFLDPKQNYMEIEWDGTFLKSDDWVEVPDGADTLTKESEVLYFWNKQDNTTRVQEDERWAYCDGYWFCSLDEYLKDNGVSIVWQRTQDEPFLTPESVVGSASGGARDFANRSTSGEIKLMPRNSEKPINIQGTINPKPDLSPQEAEPQGIDATLAERQSQYGSFEDVAAVTQDLLSTLKRTGYNSLPKPHKEALHMICSKIARIVNGNYNHKDSWHDIGGYAKLIEDSIKN